MAQPVMPASMEKLLDLLSVPSSERKFANAEIERGLVLGSSLPPPAAIFPRYIETET